MADQDAGQTKDNQEQQDQDRDSLMETGQSETDMDQADRDDTMGQQESNP